MKVAILGYGKEGRAGEVYFQRKGAEVKVWREFSAEEVAGEDFSEYDLVLRSPSVRPFKCCSSGTQYFFKHCPCPIIGVTGTKGKGTTCSLISAVLSALGRRVFLIGNIGIPAISVLDELDKDCVVVYELSSFQLWDLRHSPEVAVVLPIEPDHLNVHKNMTEYVNAKANIARWQKTEDVCIYNTQNEYAKAISKESRGEKIGYPVEGGEWVAEVEQKNLKDKESEATKLKRELNRALDSLAIVGGHNRENAEAAILAVASFLKVSLAELLAKHFSEVTKGLADFHGLPHRLEFVAEVAKVKYYDDNFATGAKSMEVAIKAFREPTVLIMGGRDKTNNEDLPEIFKILRQAENLKKVILIGESGHEIFRRYKDRRFVLAESLAEAVEMARQVAETEVKEAGTVVVIMSPAAASFDMFKDVYDRGNQFQKLVKAL